MCLPCVLARRREFGHYAFCTDPRREAWIVMDAVRYVNSGGHHLAFRVLEGAPSREVVLITPGGTVPMEYLERDRVGARLLEGLTAVGRVVLFDRRGIGLSDPITDWSRPLVAQWADDLAAIVEHACIIRPVVVSLGDYWGPARLFAADHPDALAELVLYEPAGPAASVDLSKMVSDDWLAYVCPSRADDKGFRDWFEAAGRTGASPGVATRIYERPAESCVARLAASHARIAVPTLVLRRPDNLAGSAPLPDPVGSEIPGAQRVDLPGNDYHWLGNDIDSMLAEISRFVTGESQLPSPERELCAVVFTDLVGSTERATAAGDELWKATIERHDAEVARIITHNAGRVVKSTGDGVLATFPSTSRALRAVDRIRAQLQRDDLDVRVGVHVGDVERRGDDLAGIGVHIAARVMALATAGEVLVTASVPIAATGTGHAFEAAGNHTLKGIPGTWELFRVVQRRSTT
jgi:class 3 adenylate cyclase